MELKEKYLIHYLARRNCVAERIEEDVLPYCDLTFVFDGSLEYEINSKHFTVNAGEAMFCPQGSRRKREKGSQPCVYVSVNFRCDVSDIPPLPYCITDCGDQDIDYFLTKLLEIYVQDGNFVQRKCSSLLEYIICVLLDGLSDNGENKSVAFMKRYISYNWYKKISLADVAESAHLSDSYASALFKKAVGKSMNAYINDIRISRACEILRFSSETVATVAEKTGFCDIFYFSRTFKKLKGVSPTQYRAKK